MPVIAGGLAIALIALALTWQFARQPTSPTSGVQARVPEAQALAEDQAPDIRVTTMEGEPFSLADRQGRAVVVLFSASWCGSCIPEVQKMAKLQQEYGDRGLDLLFLSVDPLDTPEDWARFRRIAEGPKDYWSLDPGQRATLAYQIRATDTKVFIDRTGRIVARYVGPTPYGAFQTEVERLL
jgi:cytochrome oxidase Cu insertion factor (SCO1/SenC/PrrC family)